MIYTIGYNNRSLPEFLNELTSRGITQLWDVRSSPWSRNAAFNAAQIVKWSERVGIYYRQCGDILGGRSEIAIGDPMYVDMLSQLVDIAQRDTVAIMCAEGDPALCHRTWDIGANLLLNWRVATTNILRDGSLEKIETTINRVRRSNFAPAILLAIDELHPFDWPENLWFR